MSSTNKVRIQTAVFKTIHNQIIAKFQTEHPDQNLPEYKLYGFAPQSKGQEHKNEISIRSEFIKTYETNGITPPQSLKSEHKWKLNGKFLRDAYKIKANTQNPFITINADYLNTFLLYLGYKDLESYNRFLQVENIVPQERTPVERPDSLSDHAIYFSGYAYIGNNIDQITPFELILNGTIVEVPKSPYYGRRYKGKIDQPDLDNLHLHSSITLSSQDDLDTRHELKLILLGNTPLKRRSFAVGYYIVISNAETRMGPFILENRIVNEYLNPDIPEDGVALGTHAPLNTQSLLKMIFENEITQSDSNLPLLQSSIPRTFFDFLKTNWNLNFTKKKIIATFHEWKKAQFTQFLNNQHYNLDNYLEGTSNNFGPFLDNVYPGWRNNQNLLEKIAGHYAMYIGCWEPNSITGEKEKKIELLRSVLTKNGKVQCLANGEREFKGSIEIYEQRILQFKLQKVDGNSNYLVILRIPDVIHDKEQDDYTFTGIFGGISTGLKPRADKALLRKIPDNDIKNPKYTPRFIDGTESGIIEELKNSISGFEQFFSLESEKDRYLQGSNLFFSNILNLPPSNKDIKEAAGTYYLYRLNFHNKVIKRYPVTISPSGKTIFIRGNLSIEGKAFLLHDQVVIHFFQKGLYEGMLNFPMITAPNNRKEGILTSNSHSNNPFSNKVLVFKPNKQPKEESSKYFYKNLIMDEQYSSINQEEYEEFKIASYSLYSSPYAIYTDLETDRLLNDSPVQLKEKAIKNHLGKLILYHFKKTNVPNCEATRSCLKMAQRMMTHWQCDQKIISSILDSQYPNLACCDNLKSEIMNYFNPDGSEPNRFSYESTTENFF